MSQKENGCKISFIALTKYIKQDYKLLVSFWETKKSPFTILATNYEINPEIRIHSDSSAPLSTLSTV